MTTEADITRYMNVLKAHRALTAIGHDAAALLAAVNACPFEDSATGTGPLHEALTVHVDATAAAACDETDPFDPNTVDADQAAAIAEALDAIAARARLLAARASQVRVELDNGLITAPRTWTPGDITGGRMLAALEPLDSSHDGHDWYGFDAMFLEGAVNALNRHRLAETIDADAYDRHIARIAAVAPVIGPEPAGSAEHVAKAVQQWRADEADASRICADPDAPTIRVRQAIHGARTYTRLAAYAADLQSPAWDDNRRKADHHMVLLYNTANRLAAAGPDAYGRTPDSADAADLFASLDEWRINAYTGAYGRALSALDTDAELSGDAEEIAYYGLYDATEYAATTAHLLDIWQAAAKLEEGHQGNVYVGVMVAFEESRTRTGVPLADAGEYAECTKALRLAMDAHPVGEHSNAAHTSRYRKLRAAITGTATPLIEAWEAVIAEANAKTITTRQLRELRELTAAAVNEHVAADKREAFTARLTQWDNVTHFLND